MTIATGTQLGPYEILAPLGAGGMGEVYRGLDTRLNREVAIKVLPSSFANAQDLLRRFEQEALATSALNHPNILTVHDFGTHEGSPFIVAELLEGEELRALLIEGWLPVRQALDCAQQITSGLAAAHAKSIVHRDLKPENIFITTDGRVKILDFGLAKLVPQNSAVDSGSNVQTRKAITDPGTVMGTVGYMSPEQVRGREADHRSDIFSFGVILYEMLSGQRAFHGESLAETMTAIVKEEPPELSEINAKISPQLDKIVRRCLEKKPEMRFQTASDLGFALSTLTTPSGARLDTATALPVLTENSPAGKAGLFGNARLWMAVAAVVTLALLASLPFTIAYLRQAPPEVRAVRSFILPPEESSFDFGSRAGSNVAVSPDGRRVAFVATTAEGKQFLWVRALDALSAQSLAGTEGATFPFWSPDSRSIGFFADGKLKKIEAAGGPALTLCDAPNGRGGTWNRDGVIVFAPSNSGTIHRVTASGGASSAVTKLDEARGETIHRWPSFLPDGEHFLYLSVGSEGVIRLASLASPESKLLLQVNSNAAYAQGYLLFMREGTLMAQPFDATRLATTGDAFPIAEQVQSALTLGVIGIFSASEQGVLAYQTGAGVRGTQLSWLDLSTKKWFAITRVAWLADGSGLIAACLEIGSNTYQIYQISYPGGEARKITNDLNAYTDASLTADPGSMVTVQENHVLNIWSSPDGEAIHARQLTHGPEKFEGIFGLRWAPDGKIVYYSLISSAPSISIMNGDGSNPRQLTAQNVSAFPAVSPDGRYIVFASRQAGEAGVWRMDIDGGNAKQLTNDVGGFSDVSPDGRWVIYSTGPPAELRIWKVSIDGGEPVRLTGSDSALPVVSPDGKSIAYLYREQENSPWRIAIIPFEGGQPTKLLDVPPGYITTVIPNPVGRDRPQALHWLPDGRSLAYIVTRDGVSNIWSMPIDGGAPKQLTNFTSGQIAWFDLSRDGKPTLFSRGATTKDVVLISGFKK